MSLMLCMRYADYGICRADELAPDIDIYRQSDAVLGYLHGLVADPGNSYISRTQINRGYAPPRFRYAPPRFRYVPPQFREFIVSDYHDLVLLDRKRHTIMGAYFLLVQWYNPFGIPAVVAPTAYVPDFRSAFRAPPGDHRHFHKVRCRVSVTISSYYGWAKLAEMQCWSLTGANVEALDLLVTLLETYFTQVVLLL